MTKFTLPITIGKKYIARNGLVVSTLGYTLANPDVIGTSHRAVWAKSGEVVGSVPGDAFDLVADYIEPTGHVHAALMAQYAQDAATNPEPWKLWEFNDADDGDGWHTCVSQAVWAPTCQYRRKPRTININGIEVPEPLRVAPAKGTKVWSPHLSSADKLSTFTWNVGNHWMEQELERGIVHLTPEAAVAHAEALLSFTKDKS